MTSSPPYKHLLGDGGDNVMANSDVENPSSASTANTLSDPGMASVGIGANQVDKRRTRFNRCLSTISPFRVSLVHCCWLSSQP